MLMLAWGRGRWAVSQKRIMIRHLDLRLPQERIHTFFLQAMKQRTRAMGFLKTIFEDGVDCILTPGKLSRSYIIHSGKLPTYPSPTLTLTSHLGQNFGLGEG